MKNVPRLLVVFPLCQAHLTRHQKDQGCYKAVPERKLCLLQTTTSQNLVCIGITWGSCWFCGSRSGSELSDDCLGGANAAGPWPTFGGRYWSISKQDLFSSPSISLTNWPTEQSELPGVEIETLKSWGERASAWTSNRLSPCASPFIRERAPQHHALTSYWTKLGHRAIFKPQGRLEKTVSGVSRHFPGSRLCP